MRNVIIGNGPAAVSAAEALRAADRACEIVMISQEAVPFYSPCPLAEYVEGSVPRDHLFLRDWQFYRDHDIQTLFGTPVTAIDTAARTVELGSGPASQVPYDKLLIATGARAFMPPIAGLADTPGVFALKTLADADGVLERLGKARRAVVIGSGFIGLEAVQALVRKGLHVTLLEGRGQVLPAMLDAEMAGRIERRLTEHGVAVRTGCSAEAVLGGEDGVRAVQADGEEIPCELVICAAGVRAETGFLAGSGVAVGRGIQVDDRMRTNVEHVYSAGDCIEIPSAPEKFQVLPIWPNAVTTGQVAAAGMLGQDRRHPGLEAVNVVRIFDVPVSSFGVQKAEQEVRWERDGAVRKVLIHAGRVVGAMMMGNVNGSGVLLDLMKKGVEVGRFQSMLALPTFSYVHSLDPAEVGLSWA